MTTHDLTIERPGHVPAGAVFDFDYHNDPELLVDPHERLLKLVHEAPPFFWTPRQGGHWVAFGYPEAFRIMREPDTFSSKLMPPEMMGPNRPKLPDGRRNPLITPIMMDPPEHTRLRAPLQKTFSPKTVMALKADIEALAIRLVEDMKPLGHADFLTAVAEPLPVRIFLKMLGLPDDRMAEFRVLAREIFEPHGIDPAKDMMRTRNIADAMLEQIVARRDDPKDDIISLLWSAEIEGEPMTIELMEDYCSLLFIAGLDTVINGMCYGVRHMAMYPETQALLRAQPELIVDATEEFLRRYSFSAPMRVVTRETEVAGHVLKPGERILIFLGAVDLDPREFPNPEVFDLARENKNHLIFGGGPHRCLGSHLARVELQTLYQVVLDRLPPFRMDPDGQASFKAGNMLSVSSLPIRWD